MRVPYIRVRQTNGMPRKIKQNRSWSIEHSLCDLVYVFGNLGPVLVLIPSGRLGALISAMASNVISMT
jgi:hypothetical protein